MEETTIIRPTIQVKLPKSGTYQRIYDMVVAAIVALDAEYHDQAVLVLRHWREGTSVGDVMTYLDQFVYIEVLPDQEKEK